MDDRERLIPMFKALAERGLLTRRRFLTAVATIGAGVTASGVLASCGPTEATPTAAPAAIKVPAATKPPAVTPANGALVPPDVKLEGKGEVIIGSWGGTYEEGEKKGFGPLFEKYYKGKIAFVPYDFGKMKAGVEAKMSEWDVAVEAEEFLLRAANEGLLQKIDCSLIPAAEELDQVARQEYGVAGDYEVYVIGYNKEKYANNPPRSWSDFFDVEKFPGARSMYVEAQSCLDPALIADGVPPDKLNEAHQDPTSIDRAFKKMEKFKATGALKKFWYRGAEAQQLLKDKEVDMIITWNGRVSQLIASGVDHVGLEWNQGLFFLAPWLLVKYNPNGKNALHFLNVACMAEGQAVFSEATHYGPTNPKALGLIPENVRQYMPSYPENLKKLVHIDIPYWVEALPKIDPRWQTFMQG